jgi:hypothetical protein
VRRLRRAQPVRLLILFIARSNNLVRLDMTYCFTSEEHDEMLRRIEALHNAAMK